MVPVSALERYLAILIMGIVVPQICIDVIVSISLWLHELVFSSDFSLVDINEQFVTYFDLTMFSDRLLFSAKFILSCCFLFFISKLWSKRKFADMIFGIVAGFLFYSMASYYAEYVSWFNESSYGILYDIAIPAVLLVASYFIYKRVEIK